MSTDEDNDLVIMDSGEGLSRIGEGSNHSSKHLKMFRQNHEDSVKYVRPGRIGTLKVYRSGKTKLELGHVQFNVSRGVSLHCEQECVCIAADHERRTNDMHRLGRITKRAICSLDVQHLLTSMQKEDAPPQAKQQQH